MGGGKGAEKAFEESVEDGRDERRPERVKRGQRKLLIRASEKGEVSQLA